MKTFIGFLVGVSAGVYLAKWLNTEKGAAFQEEVFAKASQIFGEESVSSFREKMGFHHSNSFDDFTEIKPED